ncbi:protein kinase domain containing protein [Acanthamoeba castellanii str. Neff]|uniref:non-specific serine/threonine protein kinase n=1 Tax=Acanthamoeba castellanii (strain ATCC 30010 / Neff) TaxID=1257118 RepID=L8GEV7_ACACF|nr:protein kinase domain containing protein [Acanthamoeba castellanii str. Neff]ELR11537.1 protein kinase domain containing protein [Acanthamoeba castellanii str. Neff]
MLGEGSIPDSDWEIPQSDIEFGVQIAQGNFGRIYKGSYFGTEVAIKLILPCETPDMTHKYIEREVTVLKGLRHPLVVNFMGVARRNGDFYIVTEWVDGGNLRTLTKDKNDTFTWSNKVSIARDIAVAMAFLHGRGIIHRDLKADNLLITKSGQVKLCDFGFARARNTGYMTLAGTEEYMAPEVILGMEYDEKVDVYSYGVVLLELISRKVPPVRGPAFAFDFSPEQLQATIPADCPQRLEDLVLRCINYKPGMRPAFKDILGTCKELLEELSADEDASGNLMEGDETLRTKRALEIMKNRPKTWSLATTQVEGSAGAAGFGGFRQSQCGFAVTFWPTRSAASGIPGTPSAQSPSRPWGTVSPATGAVMLREGKTVTLPSELVRKGDCFIEEDKVIVRESAGVQTVAVSKKYSWNTRPMVMKVTFMTIVSPGGWLSITVEFDNHSPKVVTGIQAWITEQRAVVKKKKLVIVEKPGAAAGAQGAADVDRRRGVPHPAQHSANVYRRRQPPQLCAQRGGRRGEGQDEGHPRHCPHHRSIAARFHPSS